jgi:hypothetical protein
MTQQERQSKRAYKKMMKAYKKKLVKAAKEYTPWDSDYSIFELLEICLNWSYDYFNQDYNVWQDKDAPCNNFGRILDSLKECCRNIKLIMEDEFDSEWHKRMNEVYGDPIIEDSTIRTGDKEIPVKKVSRPGKPTPEQEKELDDLMKKAVKERDKCLLDLFMTIAKNIDSWVD